MQPEDVALAWGVPEVDEGRPDTEENDWIRDNLYLEKSFKLEKRVD